MAISKIFVSVGNVDRLSPEQKAFRDQVYEHLQRSGLIERVLLSVEWSSTKPLQAIQNVINECSGAIILAFERDRFPLPEGNSGREARFPTVWNQIEAALAYTRGLPVLVIAEEGLREDGLLATRYDWSVYHTKLLPGELKSSRFQEWFGRWRSQLTEGNFRSFDPGKLTTLGDLVRNVRMEQAGAVVGAIVAVLAAVATVAYRVGAGSWPWK
jgi:hypothetical protein